MDLSVLAKRLADTKRLGMTPEIVDKLKLKSEDVVRGQLMAMIEGDRGPMAVYLLGIYVVDDTDLIGAGEIYWWSIPVLVDKDGKARWSPVSGLPAGAPPHKCNSHQWMTNISLKDPPLLAVIPPEDDLASCVIRLGIYDDDRKPPDMPASFGAAFAALAGCLREGLKGAEQITTPVRDALHKALHASEDDVLVDESVTIERGASGLFGVGFVASVTREKARAYYIVRDVQRTETAGPVSVAKGETSRLTFPSKLRRGGRLSVFAVGAADCSVFGELTVDKPFAGIVVDDALAEKLSKGFEVTGKANSEIVAFYTPP